MFRNRRSSQKPAEEFYAAFKQSYPNVGPGTITTPITSAAQSAALLTGSLSDPTMDHRPLGGDSSRSHESAFRGVHEEWRLTPSFMETNPFSFASLSHQAQGYCTPGSAGAGTFYHNKAGDLHTPNLGFPLGTPLSLSQEDRSNAAPAFDMQGFQPGFLDSHPFQAPDAFVSHSAFVPASFHHQDSGFGTMTASHENTPQQQTIAGCAVSQHLSTGAFSPGHGRLASDASESLYPSGSKFRYQVTLNAPTAMVKHADEIPVTYLNKGQAYAISICDQFGVVPSPIPTKYRTVIRISFEDQQQRQRPGACWQLWKEGRGLAEAHQRGGKLQAVEYVDPNQGGEMDSKRSRAEVERSSFDCFSVTWSPAPGASTAECSVAVRFNFLSTDFSHSKGVKGIPVRLCAKTEIISPGTPDSPPGPISEVCFCKVKLFRDHGAERKLSNDIAHIKKTIEKLKHQMAQVESGVKDLGKRKRSGSMAKGGINRPAKVQKHKRTWSLSSQGSGGRPGLEEDLQFKLSTLQNMFSSTKPYSLLYLKGYDEDDPDLFPVTLPGQLPDATNGAPVDRRTSRDQKASEAPSPSDSSASPSSMHSMPTTGPSTEPPALGNTGPENHVPDDWDAFAQFTNTDFSQSSMPAPPMHADGTTKVQRKHSAAYMTGMPQWIETVGIDPDYKAPPEPVNKPIACVYAMFRCPGKAADDDCYKAIYLTERNVAELVDKLAMQCQLETSQISRMVQVNPRGLKIIVDDAVVRELPEGQDMIVEFLDTPSDALLKREHSPSPGTLNAFEMRLLF